MTSGVTLCLTPALQMQRQGLTEQRIKAELQRIPEACAQPLLCAHRATGCREVNARYLRDVCAVRRLRDAARVVADAYRSPIL